jgi:hypothetical protein
MRISNDNLVRINSKQKQQSFSPILTILDICQHLDGLHTQFKTDGEVRVTHGPNWTLTLVASKYQTIFTLPESP